MNLKFGISLILQIFTFCLFVVSVNGASCTHGGSSYGPHSSASKAKNVEKPKPYEFAYDIKDEQHNSQARQETGDAHGNMKGSYRIQLANGLNRWVQYVADEEGFRATIETNEPGTDSQNPADVVMNANPIEVKEEPKKHPAHGYGHR